MPRKTLIPPNPESNTPINFPLRFGMSSMGWARMDSDHRSTRYKLVALAAKLLARFICFTTHYSLSTILLFLPHYLVKTIHRLPRLPVEVVDCRDLRVDLPDDLLHVGAVFHPGKTVAKRRQ